MPSEKLPSDAKVFLDNNGYVIVAFIESGGTASVFKAKSKNSNQIYAVKFIELNAQSEKLRKEFLPNELKIIKKLKHEFIIKTHKVLENDKYVFIICDYAEGGSMIALLEKEEPLGENKVKIWFQQIASALDYCHSKGIAHRDIKADNILLHNGKAMLTDFGYACISRDANGKVIMSKEMCGTLEYQSPESISGSPYDPFISDCFSLGVLLFTMITNTFPFGSGEDIRTPDGRVKLIKDIKNRNWQLTDNHSKNTKLNDLFKKLLNPDIKARIKTNEVLKHDWLKNICCDLKFIIYNGNFNLEKSIGVDLINRQFKHYLV